MTGETTDTGATDPMERIDVYPTAWHSAIGGKQLDALPTHGQRDGEAWPILQVTSITGAAFYYLASGSDARALLKEIRELADAESASLRSQLSRLKAQREELRAACEKLVAADQARHGHFTNVLAASIADIKFTDSIDGIRTALSNSRGDE